MPTNFPGSADDFTNPTAGSALNSPSHAGQHANLNDAVEALELKVGINADSFVGLDATIAPQTYVLPLAATRPGLRIAVKKTDSTANSVTVATLGSDEIDGVRSRVLSTLNSFIEMISDGSNWQIVSGAGAAGPGPTSPPTIAFTTTPASVSVNAVTATFTVARYTSTGALDTSGSLTLGLASPGLTETFFATNGTTAITSVTIPVGSSSASFRYANSVAGTYTVTVSATGYTAVTQQQVILPGSVLPTKLAFVTGAQTLTNGIVSTLMTVELQDATSAAVASVGARTINLSSDSAGDTFYASTDPGGVTPITSRTMADATSQVSFFYRDTSNGAHTITASDSSSSATLALDGTAPATVSSATTAASVTTGSFTPPANSVLVARVSCNGVTPDTLTLSSSPALTWVRAHGAFVSPQPASTAIWLARQPASTATTVTATRTTVTTSGITLSVDVVTGAEASWGGASGTASGATGLPTKTITTTRNGSIVLAVSSDKAAKGAATVGVSQTLQDEVLAPSIETAGGTILGVGVPVNTGSYTTAGAGMSEGSDSGSGAFSPPGIGCGWFYQVGSNTTPQATFASVIWGAIGATILDNGSALTFGGGGTLQHGSASDSTSYATASGQTFTNNNLVLIWALHSRASVDPTLMTSITGCVKNAFRVGSQLFTSGTDHYRLELWAAQGTGVSDQGHLNFAETQSGCVGKWVEVANAETGAGAVGLGVNAVALGTATSGTASVTLPTTGIVAMQDQHNWRYDGAPNVGTYTLNLGSVSGQQWNMAVTEVRTGPGTITAGTQSVTITAASGGGTGQKSASNIVWHGPISMVDYPASVFDGSEVHGPQTPAGNLSVRSFNVQMGYPFNFGNNENWATSATQSVPPENRQWRLITTGFIPAVHNRNGKVFLGCRLRDAYWAKPLATGGDGLNHAGAPMDYFNDARVAEMATALGNFAAAAKRLGADGVFFDCEPYGADWSWACNFAGSAGASQPTQAARRAKCRSWGVQVGAAIAAGYPGCDIYMYPGKFIPGGIGTANSLHSGLLDDSLSLTTIDFFDGVFDSYASLGSFNLWEADFYESPAGITSNNQEEKFDTAFWFGWNGRYAYLSRNFSNWANMASRINSQGFVASDGDGTAAMKPFPVAAQAVKFAAARRWNMNNLVPNFSTGNLGLGPWFNYQTGVADLGGNFTAPGAPLTPPGYRTLFNDTAATPATVQTGSFTWTNLSVTRPGGGSNPIVVTGRVESHGISGAYNAIIDGAIRQVTVTTASGGTKQTQMTLVYTGALDTDVPTAITGWYMAFTYTGTVTAGNVITLTAEDTHLNTGTNTSLTAP